MSPLRGKERRGAATPSTSPARKGRRAEGPTLGRLFFGCLPAAVGWFIAVFTLVNLLGGGIRSGFDANFIWMPLRPYDWWGTRLVLGIASFLLAWSLIRPARGVTRYVATQTLMVFLSSVCLWDGATFYSDLWEGAMDVAVPLPFSALVLAGFLMQVRRMRREFRQSRTTTEGRPEVRVLAGVAGLACVCAAFLAGQFFLIGGISHHRKVDCIIVMGAGVMPGGVPSMSLYDRTREACDLVNAGWGDHLILSGGPSEHGPTEPEVMAEIAERRGVPVTACVLDERGHSTRDTAISVRRIMRHFGWRSAMVVSHDYHLSRTRLAFRRAGMTVTTWPARRSRIAPHDGYVVLRESAAWWYYYVRPFWDALQSDREMEGRALSRPRR